MLVVAAGIRLVARVLRGCSRSRRGAVVERIFSWLAWIAAVLWIVGLLPAVMEEMEAVQLRLRQDQVNLLSIIQGVLSAGLVLVLALWISAVVERKLLRQRCTTCRCARWRPTRSAPCCWWWASCSRCRWSASTSPRCRCWAARIGVGLGFGLQKLAANYVSGFVILAERSLRIGDTVQGRQLRGRGGGHQDPLHADPLAGNGRESIVPNEKLITERVENLSLADPRVLLTTDVSVGYDSDVDVVRAVLLEAASGPPRVMPTRRRRRAWRASAPTAWSSTVLFWISDPENGQLARCVRTSTCAS